MRVISRAMCIWMTTAMLLMQTLCPVNLSGCCCRQTSSGDTHLQQQSCCSQVTQPERVLATGPKNCCTQKTRLVDASGCESCSARCCCGRNNSQPALPVQSHEARETMLQHPFLTPNAAESVAFVQVQAFQASEFPPRALLSQKAAQVLFCVSLI